MLALSTAGRCGSPAPTTITGRPDWLTSWQAAHRAETSSGPRSCISSTKTATPLPRSAASPPTSFISSTRSISMSPESARPRTGGTSMPGLQRSLQLRVRPGLPLGEGPDHAEHVVGIGVSELAHRLVQRARQRPAQRLVGPGLELAGPPALAHGLAAQRVEQHGLADPAQSGQHQRPLGTTPRHPLEHHVERPHLLVATGQLGRPLPGAGRVGIPDRVHGYDGMGPSSGFRRFRRVGVSADE